MIELDKKVVIAQIFATLVVFVVGSALQIALWHKPGETRLDALVSHGYFWFFYIILGGFSAEHAFKWFKQLSRQDHV
jgi:hypothetical protein